MSAVLDAIAAGDLYTVGLSMALPDLDFKVSHSSFTSVTNGHHAGKVIQWGRIKNAASENFGDAPPPVVTTVLIDDKDRTLAMIYSGTRAKEVRGSVATIYLMAQSVASVDTRFVGIVSKMKFTADLNCEVTLRVNDDQLSRVAPRSGWALNAQTFPNADPAAHGKVAGLVYGGFDSSRLRVGPGLIPAPCVDRIIYRYGGWAGNLKSLTRVYVDSVEVASSAYGSNASAWNDGNFEYETIHGRDYTFVRFNSDRGTSVITIDCEGIEDAGTGGGALLVNPVTQWENLMSLFVFADYKSGASLASHALIGDIDPVRNYIGLNGDGVDQNLDAVGAYFIDQFKTGLEITSVLCRSWGLYSFWTPEGTISLGLDNPFVAPYAGTRFIWYKDELGPFQFDEADAPVTSSITARLFHSPSDNVYLSSFEVQDAGAPSETQESVDVEWSAVS